MANLHILNKAPDHPRFQTGISAVSGDDTLLLTENAVFAAVMGQPLPARVVALRADLEARGLSPDQMAPDIGSVDFNGFVALTETASQIISW